MARIVIVGAGVSGLAAALLLARDGHDVEVLERDADGAPAAAADAWERWERGGVKQFRQAHYLQPRGRAVLEQELPDVARALSAAGAARFTPMSALPPFIADRAPRPGDERFETVTARRPVLEQVLARAADAEPRVAVRRGVAVAGLIASRRDGIPHVTGVRTDRGGVTADLVVDAMGRRSPLPAWLAEAGSAPVQESAEDSGFAYYTRFFRSADGRLPDCRGPLNAPLGTVGVLTLPADNGTWSITLYCTSGDRPLKRLRHPEGFDAVVAACPLHAHWLDAEPITGVQPMAGVLDRHRRLVAGGVPVATGIAHLGDAWACTNPSLGRGMTLGLLHACLLRDLARSGLEDPQGFALAWDEATDAELGAWYRDTIEQDRALVRRMDALRNGWTLSAPADPASAVRAALPAALLHDAEVFRMFLENRSMFATMREGLARPGMVDRILQVARENEPPPAPGPDRERLLALLDMAPALSR